MKGEPLPTPPACLTIAGFDPTGGAGVTADLRVFRRMGRLGAACITAVTSQNLHGVTDVFPVPRPARQLEALAADFTFDAVKTGQLPTVEAVRAVVDYMHRHPAQLVVDPILFPTSGTPLVKPAAAHLAVKELFPLAVLIRPNAAEAAAIMQRDPPTDEGGLMRLTREFSDYFGRSCLVTGGALPLPYCVDAFCDGLMVHLYRRPRLPFKVHGTGCHHSALLCALLTRDYDILQVVERAHRIMTRWLENATIDPAGGMRMFYI